MSKKYQRELSPDQQFLVNEFSDDFKNFKEHFDVVDEEIGLSPPTDELYNDELSKLQSENFQVTLPLILLQLEAIKILSIKNNNLNQFLRSCELQIKNITDNTTSELSLEQISKLIDEI